MGPDTKLYLFVIAVHLHRDGKAPVRNSDLACGLKVLDRWHVFDGLRGTFEHVLKTSLCHEGGHRQGRLHALRDGLGHIVTEEGLDIGQKQHVTQPR